MPQDTNDSMVEERDIVDVPDESQSMQSVGSMIVSPNRDSTTYPYRTVMEERSFPVYHLMAKPGIDPETFNRSLSMLGHGFPLWDPIGNLSRPKEQLNTGISIGDVGFLGRKGDFHCYFNLFLPPDSPRQFICPPDLVPLELPLPSEISVNTSHFPAGTALVSNGIESSVLSSSPLNIQFTVHTREGGIVVFPDGATREDLVSVSTTRIQEYVKKHALNWYVYFKEQLRAVVYPNGSLYVVTGTDKATEWACCITSNRRTKIRKLWKPITITYQGAKESSPHRWLPDPDTEYEMVHKKSRPIELVDVGQLKCALFIRGMRVTASVSEWTRHVLKNNPARESHFSVLRTIPAFGLRAKIQTVKECRRSYSQQCPDEQGEYLRIPFHPLDIIARFLLKENPCSTLAIVNDSIWSAVADKSDASLESITHLIIQTIDKHETSIEDGLITLIPRTNSQEHASSFWLPNPTSIQRKYRSRQISRQLAKFFPGPPIPEESLLQWDQI